MEKHNSFTQLQHRWDKPLMMVLVLVVTIKMNLRNMSPWFGLVSGYVYYLLRWLSFLLNLCPSNDGKLQHIYKQQRKGTNSKTNDKMCEYFKENFYLEMREWLTFISSRCHTSHYLNKSLRQVQIQKLKKKNWRHVSRSKILKKAIYLAYYNMCNATFWYDNTEFSYKKLTETNLWRRRHGTWGNVSYIR